MFDITEIDPLILFSFFPGLLFLGIGILLWINFSYLLFKIAEETPDIRWLDGFQLFYNTLQSNSRNTQQQFSEGIIWLIFRFIALIIVYLLFLAILLLPFENDFLLILVLLVFAVFFHIGYELATPNLVRFKRTYALHEFFIIIIFVSWSFSVANINFLELRTNPWASSLENQIFQVLLIVLFFIGLGHVNSYLSLSQSSSFSMTPSQLTNQNITENHIHPLEKILQWLSEGLTQVIFALIFTLLIGQSLLFAIVGQNFPSWWYYFGLIMIWASIMVISLLSFFIFYRYKNYKLGELNLWGTTIIFTFFVLNVFF